jgi:hypothetical protein
VAFGLGGGYVLIAFGRCLELWDANRLDPRAPRGPAEAGIAAYLLFALGVVLFVNGLDFRRTAVTARPAFRLLALAGGFLAVGELAAAWTEARQGISTILVLVSVIAAAGDAVIAGGWGVWSRAASQRGPLRSTASSRGDWPLLRRVTQVALALAYALYALSDVVTLARHPHAGATLAFARLTHALGYGIAALGHWQLVAVLVWISVAQAARKGLVLLGIGGCILAVAPYLAGTMPPAATNIQALASLALGVGWLVWAAAGRITSEEEL